MEEKILSLLMEMKSDISEMKGELRNIDHRL